MGKRRNPPKSTNLPSLNSRLSTIRHKPDVSMKKLYTIPDTFSTTAKPGEGAPTQLFHGYPGNFREDCGDGAFLRPWQLQSAGPQVLLNIDLGSNAYNDKDRKETIPTWIPPDYIERLNQTIGLAPAVGVEEAARLGIKWGKIEAIPDLGGARGDGDGVLWEQREIPGKGIGVIALKDFDTGDLILCERPMMIPRTQLIPMKDLARADHWKVLYDRLSPSQQLRFRSLHNAKRIVSSMLPMQLGDVAECIDEGIVRTNMIMCFPLGEDVEYIFGGVFALASRLNHSCGPNVSWSFIQRNFSLEVRAVKPIKQGEELVASYGCAKAQWAERQSYLLEKYQFRCRCQFCSMEGNEREESDKRRAQLKAWDQTHPSFDDWYLDPVAFGKDALVKQHEERLSVMYQEGLHMDSFGLLFLLLQDYVAVGDAKNASRIGKEAMGALIANKGSEYNQTRMEDLKRMMDRPATHPLWRMAERRVHTVGNNGAPLAQEDLDDLKQHFQILFNGLLKMSLSS